MRETPGPVLPEGDGDHMTRSRMSVRASGAVLAAAGLLLAFASRSSEGTISGLNQIITPEVQPPGTLSLGWQEQNRGIGTQGQAQIEAGIIQRLGVAYYHSFSPRTDYLGAEIGLLQSDPFHVSAGFGVGSRSAGVPQAFLIAGHYSGLTIPLAGLQRSGGKTEGIFGWILPLAPTAQIQLDYASGRENAFTVGTAWTMLSHLQVNPALFRLNDPPHRWVGRLVVSWTVQWGSSAALESTMRPRRTLESAPFH